MRCGKQHHVPQLKPEDALNRYNNRRQSQGDAKGGVGSEVFDDKQV